MESKHSNEVLCRSLSLVFICNCIKSSWNKHLSVFLTVSLAFSVVLGKGGFTIRWKWVEPYTSQGGRGKSISVSPTCCLRSAHMQYWLRGGQRNGAQMPSSESPSLWYKLCPDFCKDHLENASLHAKSIEASHGSKLRERSSKTIARIIEAGESENRGLSLAGSSYQKA